MALIDDKTIDPGRCHQYYMVSVRRIRCIRDAQELLQRSPAKDQTAVLNFCCLRQGQSKVLTVEG